MMCVHKSISSDLVSFTLVSSCRSGREALLFVIQNSFLLYIQKEMRLSKNSSHHLSTSHTDGLKGKKLSVKLDLIERNPSFPLCSPPSLVPQTLAVELH